MTKKIIDELELEEVTGGIQINNTSEAFQTKSQLSISNNNINELVDSLKSQGYSPAEILNELSGQLNSNLDISNINDNNDISFEDLSDILNNHDQL